MNKLIKLIKKADIILFTLLIILNLSNLINKFDIYLLLSLIVLIAYIIIRIYLLHQTPIH